jgi:hypothetical protein
MLQCNGYYIHNYQEKERIAFGCKLKHTGNKGHVITRVELMITMESNYLVY